MMKFKLFGAVLALLMSTSVLAAVSITDDTDYMIQAFDDLAVHFEGQGAQYPRDYYQKLVSCLLSDGDTDMHMSQIGAWKGMADYWKTNGTESDYQNHTDYWGECIGDNDERCLFTEYVEYNESK